MGNSNSTIAAMETCIQQVCAGRAGCYSIAGLVEDPLWSKPYNLDSARHPVAIIRPNNANEVAGTVKCANQFDLKVQARSGGHSYGNFGQGGLDKGGVMIDLMNLKDFSMDTDTWHATLGSGYKLGDLDQQLHKNGGRAMAHGTCPGVGIGGHATVGGLGPMSRMWGSALDHVLEVEVVTADGNIQRANSETNADLFWALRGAGASFGIITEFVVKTHPEPGSIVEYTYSFSFGRQQDMVPVFEQWQELVYEPDLDRRFSTLFIAQPLGAIITGTFYGTQEEFEQTDILAKIPSGGVLTTLVTNWLGSLGHIAETTGLYLSDLPTAFASKSLAFNRGDKLSHESISDLFDYMGSTNAGTLVWAVIFNSEGGAMADTPYDATAYPHRDAIMMYQSYAVGIPVLNSDTRDFVAGVQDKVKAGAPHANMTYAGYIDITMDRNTAQWTYWGDKVPQLQKLKQQFDPRDRFQNPQSIGDA